MFHASMKMSLALTLMHHIIISPNVAAIPLKLHYRALYLNNNFCEPVAWRIRKHTMIRCLYTTERATTLLKRTHLKHIYGLDFLQFSTEKYRLDFSSYPLQNLKFLKIHSYFPNVKKLKRLKDIEIALEEGSWGREKILSSPGFYYLSSLKTLPAVEAFSITHDLYDLPIADLIQTLHKPLLKTLKLDLHGLEAAHITQNLVKLQRFPCLKNVILELGYVKEANFEVPAKDAADLLPLVNQLNSLKVSTIMNINDAIVENNATILRASTTLSSPFVLSLLDIFQEKAQVKAALVKGNLLGREQRVARHAKNFSILKIDAYSNPEILTLIASHAEQLKEIIWKYDGKSNDDNTFSLHLSTADFSHLHSLTYTEIGSPPRFVYPKALLSNTTIKNLKTLSFTSPDVNSYILGSLMKILIQSDLPFLEQFTWKDAHIPQNNLTSLIALSTWKNLRHFEHTPKDPSFNVSVLKAFLKTSWTKLEFLSLPLPQEENLSIELSLLKTLNILRVTKLSKTLRFCQFT